MNNPGVPQDRIRKLTDAPARDGGEYVLYWMIANRRLQWNFALQRAVEHASERGLPLLIFEPLRAGYPWASDRLHRFVMDGMVDSLDRLAGSTVAYYPWIEPAPGDGSGLLATLAQRAAVVVTDDTPAFFYPAMLRAAAERLEVRLEAVDSVGLLPLSATEKAFSTAYSFRRFLQRALPEQLERLPQADPFARAELPPLERELDTLARGFRPTPLQDLRDTAVVGRLPIDHSVGTVELEGGASVASTRLQRFVADLLGDYGEHRNHPDEEHTSGLSPWLHFGHLSSHEVFATVAAEELWTGSLLATTADGARSGWWGMSASSEAFLDQLITWRELGFNMCRHRDDYDRYESLPEWARATLDEHRSDERPHLYDLDDFEAAETHDEIWNAAQTQLVHDGVMHNYLRMLWGKKIVEWSPTPEAALAVMIELNNKYALDGRDPNSYSGIFWVLGRYDRAWGPERPVFGKVRYMTSSSTRRKLRLKSYLDKYRRATSVASAASGS
ncbi:MAG: deoxyribodipyrimidine photolyase [Acidobacteriota bacterium]|jgi:deoxyribodipyrimidine photo-lyase